MLLWISKTEVHYGKKNLPFETKELPLCFLNQCCSSIYIYIFMISRVLLLRGETAKRVKKSELHDYFDYNYRNEQWGMIPPSLRGFSKFL